MRYETLRELRDAYASGDLTEQTASSQLVTEPDELTGTVLNEARYERADR